MNKLVQKLIKHPLVAATATSLVVGAGNYVLKYALSRLTVELQLDQHSANYNEIIDWVVRSGLLKHSNAMKLGGRNSGTGFTIPDGNHWSKYHGKPMLLSKATSVGDYGNTVTLKITLVGGTKDDLQKIIDEAITFKDLTSNIDIQVWQDSYWQNIKAKNIRTAETFILKSGQKERILTDIEWFLSNQEWYGHRGIPYHRGYLFSGPPGTGKSTIISVIASKFKKPIAMVNLSALKDDDALYSAIANVPANAIIALEDIDCIGIKRENNTKGKNTGITLAGVLNCLDGMITPDGSIIIMTTNYPDKLDPALIRPGRADLHEVFDLLGEEEQEKLSLLFYDHPVAVNKPMGAAILQNLYMRHPDDWKAAQRELDTM